MPFTYPSAAHSRRHRPDGYTDYTSYKPWLRDEFTFRCVFCLVREVMCPLGQDDFVVEHLTPKSQRPDLECDYSNLLYACQKCNSFKGELGPVLDPCIQAYGHHLSVKPDGAIEAQTGEGAKLVTICRLDREQLTEFRRRTMRMLQLAEQQPQSQLAMMVRLMILRHPANLPDLGRLKPLRNDREQGVAESYFELRRKGILPATY